MTGMWGFDDNGRRPKKRSKTAIALRKKRKRPDVTDDFDAPPSGGDDFDLSDLLGVKKIKLPVQELLEERKTERTVVTSVPTPKLVHSDSEEDDISKDIVPDPMLEEKRVARILKIDPERASRGKAPKIERLPGESRKAFQRRVKSETRQLIKNEQLQQRNPEKRQRKKEFLNKKKKAKSNSNHGNADSDGDYKAAKQNSPEDGFITGEQAVARAALGDQVERPPVFEQLPRGARAKTTIKSKDKNVSIEAEQKAMENVRRRVQAQYALVKAKRRKMGGFHL